MEILYTTSHTRNTGKKCPLYAFKVAGRQILMKIGYANMIFSQDRIFNELFNLPVTFITYHIFNLTSGGQASMPHHNNTKLDYHRSCHSSGEWMSPFQPGKTLFEPTCAICSVGSYASLSVCLSVCTLQSGLDQKSDQKIIHIS